MATDEQKKEVADLYRRLAKRWNWPLPATWIGDRETVMNDIDNALICLRGLVTDQCPPAPKDPLELARAHHAFEHP
jgi:hypothetical protein